jgi:hypothetical protein
VIVPEICIVDPCQMQELHLCLENLMCGETVVLESVYFQTQYN